MSNYKQNDRSRGKRDSSRTTMHDAVCDECGKDCKVPFRPTGDKPIYCSDCFEKRGGRGSNRSGRRDSARPSSHNLADKSVLELTEKIKVLNSKLDNIIELMTEKKSKEEKPESKVKKAKKTTKKKAK